MKPSPRVGIVTFHNTPNFGATLQCYALSRFLQGLGANVEIVNYQPLHARLQYAKSLFLGKRRGLANVRRLHQFRRFVATDVSLSGAPISGRHALGSLSERYDMAITGSDEVWKVDHMRPFDPTYYLDFCDRDHTRLVSYAASTSTVTNLLDLGEEPKRLLARFHAISTRDPHTSHQVTDLVDTTPIEVLDPTFLHDWSTEPLPPVLESPYIAVYSWLSREEMKSVRRMADFNGLDVACVGCRHPDADYNLLGIGPREWLSLIKHSELVVTNFFHGIAFALHFRRPYLGHIDEAKRIKLDHLAAISGTSANLHNSLAYIDCMKVRDASIPYEDVQARLSYRLETSRNFLTQQLALATRSHS